MAAPTVFPKFSLSAEFPIEKTAEKPCKGGGLDWTLTYQPGEPRAAISLNCVHNQLLEWSVTAAFRARLVDCRGETRCVTLAAATRELNNRDNYIVFEPSPNTPPLDTIASADGKLRVVVDVTVHKTAGIETSAKWRLTFDKQWPTTDVVLTICDGAHRFHVSRAVLAIQSAYFEQMFYGGFSEKGKNEVAISGAFKPEAFRDMLRLVYNCPYITANNVWELAEYVEYFNFVKAKDILEDHLIRGVPQEFSVEQKIMLAEKHVGYDKLMMAAISGITCVGDINRMRLDTSALTMRTKAAMLSRIEAAQRPVRPEDPFDDRYELQPFMRTSVLDLDDFAPNHEQREVELLEELLNRQRRIQRREQEDHRLRDETRRFEQMRRRFQQEYNHFRDQQ